MKTFYEMLQLLENSNKSKFSSYSNHDEEIAAYEKIDQALNNAGIPWDQDEFNVLYGKWVDMTLVVGPNKQERVQGVIYPREIKQDEEHHGAYGLGYEINHKTFYPASIVEIHGIRVHKTYDDILDDWHDDQDYERTLRSLPY